MCDFTNAKNKFKMCPHYLIIDGKWGGKQILDSNLHFLAKDCILTSQGNSVEDFALHSGKSVLWVTGEMMPA